MEKMLSVAAIEEGTVIDHIPVFQALKIVQLLKLTDGGSPVTIGLNLPSKSMGRKDLIKVEKRFLTEKEASDIAVFAPLATINIIRKYKLEKKVKAELPKVIEGILTCPNPTCITRSEHIRTVFFVEEFKNIIHLQCKYCEKVVERDRN